MKVALVGRDLITTSRVLAAAGGRVEVVRYDEPAALPRASGVSLLLVDWSDRQPGWGQALVDWRTALPPADRPRLILFGPHTDLTAHAEARAGGLGPMWARSRLIRELGALLEG